MRACIVLVICAACSFRHGASGGAIDGTTSDVPPGQDDAGHEIDTWTVDTAAEFAMGERVDLGIDPWGSITPAGYFYGSIYTAGIDGMALWHPNDPSFSVDSASGIATTGATLWTGTALTPGNANLSTLGITGNTFSAYAIADLYLTAGTHQIRITGSDVAFIEIASPHATQYTALAVSKGSAATMAFDAPAADWYPVRIGWSSTASGWTMDLQDTPPGGGGARHFARNELRARVDEPRGLMQLVFGKQLLLGARSSHQLAGDVMPSLSLPLYGQPSPGNVWSARWVGQFHADAVGTYTLQVDSVAGNRIAVAGQGSGSNYAHDVPVASRSTVAFTTTAAGWYDLAFDLNEPNFASPALTLQVASGPELAGMPLPLARTRAVEPPGDRLASSTITANASLPDQGQTTVTLPAIAGLANETVTSIGVRAFISNPEYSSLTITLANPNGDTFTLPSTGFTLNGNLDATFYWTVDASTTGAATLLANATVGGGSWTLTVRDNSNTSGNTGGQVNDVELVLHTSGGPPAIATDSLWTSQVVDTVTGLVSVDSVTWDERAPTQPATVRLRACDAPCTTEAWLPATQGAALDLGTGHRYLQAQVALHSDGAAVPEVRRLAVVYKRNAP